MAFSTPFFPGFPRPRRRAPARAALTSLTAAARGPSALRSACGAWLPDALLQPGASHGPNSRCRLFTPLVTFWAFLAQVLAGSSCREAVRRLLAQAPERAPEEGAALSGNTAAYCQARARLPLALLERLGATLSALLCREVPQAALWQGHRVRLIDGTTASMPDTARNQARWPQSANQQPGCGFPTLKMVGLFCLHSGALLQRVCGRLQEGELTLARQLWAALQPGEVLLGDRGFCSYYDLAQLAARGVHAVLRLHGARPADFRRGRRLGREDRLVTWRRPAACAKAQDPQAFAALPASLPLRYVRFRVEIPGFRSRQIVLVTTLLDPAAYPKAALAALYRQRWEIELHWRECKATLGLDVLRCQSPAMIEKELLLHLLAYNLIRALMQRAALLHHQPLARLSFQGTIDTVSRFAEEMHAVAHRPRKRAALLARCLAAIAADLLPERPHRVEPRALKRRPKPYDWLSVPRPQTRAKKAARRQAKSAGTALS